MKFRCYLFIAATSMCLQSTSVFSVGLSGMEQVDPNSYLVVIDKKSFEDGDRIGLLKVVKGQAPYFFPLKINHWGDDEGQASDLESVCKIPGRDNEYLLAESGYWDGKYGRIFHILLNGKTVAVKHVYKVPKIVASSKSVDGDNFEGIVCFEIENTVYIVLGERGGSSTYKNGYLRIGILDYSNASLSWDEYADKAVEIVPPENWNNAQSKRSISDLYMDDRGVIWAVATEDAGDEGPFRSIVYKAAVAGKTAELPVRATHSQKASWIIDGFKVEALAGPACFVKDSYMSIGTEDEFYPGAWRPLFKHTN